VAAGATHALVLTERGRVWAWGSGALGATGQGRSHEADDLARPVLGALELVKADFVSAGGTSASRPWPSTGPLSTRPNTGAASASQSGERGSMICAADRPQSCSHNSACSVDNLMLVTMVEEMVHPLSSSA